MSKNKPHILLLGEVGFPVGFGAIQRLLLMAKGLVENGCKATVLSFKGVHGTNHNFPPEGEIEGVHYKYTSGSIHRPSSFVQRNKQKFLGKLAELFYIRKLKKAADLEACLVSTMDVDALVLYWLWLKIHGIPMVLNYVELNSSIASRSGFKKRVNDYLFDRLAPRLNDGIAPISEYLIEQVKEEAPNQPILKIPIICDFDKFNPAIRGTKERPSLLYCGAASYQILVKFVLEAFDHLEINDEQVYLDFILGGSDSDLAEAKKKIEAAKNKAHIRLFPNVPHQEIPEYYAQASALIIPLRPTVQDAARFPHKLGEYLASGRAVITTPFGEIKHYDFIDKETALVADDYSPLSFSEKMQFVLNNPEQTEQIGQNGRQMGIENFNYKDLGHSLLKFMLPNFVTTNSVESTTIK